MLKFYDFEFNLLHTQLKYISTKWNILYNGIGTFEAHFPIESDVAKLIYENLNPSEGKLLALTDGQLSAVIIGYNVTDDFAMYGRTCNWLLSKRITKGFDTKNATSDAITREIVSNAFFDSEDFALGSEIGLEEEIEFMKEGSTLTSEVVAECLKLQSCGHTLDFDVAKRMWIYKNLCGKELNLTLTEVSGKAYDTQLSYDILDYADCGYYERENDLEGGAPEESVTTYLASEGTRTGMYRMEALLDGIDESEAQSELDQKKAKDESSFKLRGKRYGVDYNLGDVVRVQIKKGSCRKTVKKRISGMEIVHNSTGRSERPVFEED